MEREPIAVRSVKDIEGSEKRCLESMLGQKLRQDQQVFIMAFTPGAVPDEVAHRTALAEIHDLQAKAAAYANAHGITEDEIDAAVDEAMQHVRRRPE
jgi:hypothetical protein